MHTYPAGLVDTQTEEVQRKTKRLTRQHHVPGPATRVSKTKDS